jgi:hypothetical protein
MTTKECSRCHEVKPLSEFDYKKQKNVYASYCKDCRRAWLREHYQNNRQYYIDKARRRTDRIIEENREKLVAYLRLHPCVDCGEPNIVFLEFDHITGKKDGEVSAMIADGCSWAKVEKEMQKCVVRCVKCHRLKTYKEINWWGFKYL